MAHLRASAGRFQLDCFTDGFPAQVDVLLEGVFLTRIIADDLPDLAYAVQRLALKIGEHQK